MLKTKKLSEMFFSMRGYIPWALIFLVGAVFHGANLFKRPNTDHLFRETQTAWVTREFTLGQINVASYPLHVFGHDTQIPMEVPIFQALTAAISKFAGWNPEIVGKIISFVFLVSAALIMIKAFQELLSTTGKYILVCVVLFSPFSAQWSTAFLVESTALLAGAIFVFVSRKHGETGLARHFTAGCFSLVVLVLVKVTSAPGMVLLAAIAMYLANSAKENRGRQTHKFSLAYLAGSSLIAIGAMAFWTHYSDRVKEGSSLGSNLTSRALFNWNFGTLEQRYNVEVYQTIFSRIDNQILGIPGTLVIALALAIALFAKNKKLLVVLLGLIGSTLINPFLFLNLYFVHSYYLLGIVLELALLLSLAWSVVEHELRKMKVSELGSAVVFVLVLIGYFSTNKISMQEYQKMFRTDNPPAVSALVRDSSTPDDLVATLGCDWDPAILYFAHRDGLMFPEWLIANNVNVIAEAFKHEKPTKLLICGSSGGYAAKEISMAQLVWTEGNFKFYSLHK